jgi:hypothetical protein
MLNKPTGFVCSHSTDEGPRVFDLLPVQWLSRKPSPACVGRYCPKHEGTTFIAHVGADHVNQAHELACSLLKPPVVSAFCCTGIFSLFHIVSISSKSWVLTDYRECYSIDHKQHRHHCDSPICERASRKLKCRLDKDTSGLLLITTDSSLVHELTSPKKNVIKCYQATLEYPVSPQEISTWVCFQSPPESSNYNNLQGHAPE